MTMQIGGRIITLQMQKKVDRMTPDRFTVRGDHQWTERCFMTDCSRSLRAKILTLLPATAVVSSLLSASAAADGLAVTRILSVDATDAQLMVQQTPLAVRDGYVYTANIEPKPEGSSTDTSLRTVLRQGTRQADGQFEWKSRTVDDYTAASPFHTAPAVGIDREGHVHVAYNMHNLPWQYVRTDRPHDIESLEFRGQRISEAEIDRAFLDNRTSFPTLGKAEIPGNQITYPAFFRDRADELHLSYRFAARPGRSFPERTMSAGVSIYDLASRSWSGIGGIEDLHSGDFRSDDDASSASVSIAGGQGWTVYHPDVAFDGANRMHVQFFWRRGTAGRDLVRPCHVIVRSDGRFMEANGDVLSPPVRPSDCGNMGFANDAKFSTQAVFRLSNSGVPHALVSPQDGKRQILKLEGTRWTRQEAPYGATEIFFDANDTLYAIASGLRILRREDGFSSWELVYSKSEGGDCYPRAVLDEQQETVYVHTLSCNLDEVNVYEVSL